MQRENQIEYCKICTRQKFDIKQGIICGLTNQKPDFKETCPEFNINSSKVEELYEKQTQEKKTINAYGFPPTQTDQIKVPDLTKERAYIVALEAAKRLKWKVSFMSESGFIAYTGFSLVSWSEAVQVIVNSGYIQIESKCLGIQIMDWGKNRKNINRFLSTFNEARTQLGEPDVETQMIELREKNFVDAAEDILNPASGKYKKKTGFLSLFTPSKGYFVTPLIINLNIFIFLLMILSGVHLLLPSNDSLLVWGANFRPVTMDGQWWRLLTSTFLHIGVLHLIMNMYALIFIGLLLEPHLGKTRFLIAYLLTGIAASATSLYWNDFTISAGASGAIFGMYGVFIALLTTNLIAKDVRKPLLISIGIFIFYNLTNGTKGGIDNAAHIGGLISGLAIGFLYYPGLAKPHLKLKLATIAVITILTGAFSYMLIQNTSSDLNKYLKDMEQFARLEEKALGLYNLYNNPTDQQILDEIEINGIRTWYDCKNLIQKTETYDLPEAIHAKNSRLLEYCDLRIKTYKAIQKAIKEDTDIYDNEINKYTLEIENIINELTYAEQQ